MAYSTIPKGSLYMNPVLYTGNGSTQSITGVNFQPDWTWIKNRTDSVSNSLTDIVRGANKGILSNSFDAETTNSSNGYLASFDSDGFTTANAGGYNNANAKNYVSWNWKANGAGSANTDGDIASTVSANTTSGFSICSWTGNGNGSQSVGHGLGLVPKIMFVKNLNSAQVWRVYVLSLGSDNGMILNTTASAGVDSSLWQSSTASSSIFYLGSSSSTNGNGNSMIAYIFSDIKGFSKMGSYVGNGSTDGTFVYTGFSPSFVLYKDSTSVSDWVMKDNRRPGFNVIDDVLYPNLTNAEGSGADIDFLSNGFKARTTAANTNKNNAGFIYMAFAENPFVATSGTNAIPVTAR